MKPALAPPVRPAAPALRPPIRPAAAPPTTATALKATKPPEPDAVLLDRARKSGESMTFVLLNGDTFAGKVLHWGNYSIRVQTNAGERLVFKHALSELRPGGEDRHPATGDVGHPV